MLRRFVSQNDHVHPLNPDVEFPYCLEMEQESVNSVWKANEVLIRLMDEKKKHAFSDKYHCVRAVDWLPIETAFKACISFQPSEQLTAKDLLEIVTSKESSNPAEFDDTKVSFPSSFTKRFTEVQRLTFLL